MAKTKKAILALTLSVMMITVFMPSISSAAASETNLSLASSAESVAVGETFTITVSTKAAQLSAFIGGVNYNNSVVECMKIEGTRADEEGVYLQKSANDDFVQLGAENNASGGSVGFYRSDPGEVKYRAQQFAKITFRAKAAGDAGISLYENSAGTSGFNMDPIDGGVKVTAFMDDGKNADADKNISASVSSETVRVGNTFTVTISTKAMRVSTFTGGIKFKSDQVEYQGYSGFREGKEGAFLTKTNGDYVEVDVEESTDGNAVGMVLINTNNTNYKEGKLVNLTFKALKAGPIDMTLYEDSDGYDGYIKDPIPVGFSVTAVENSITNISAAASASTLGKGDTVDITVSVNAMKVSTFTGGIKFDKNCLKLTKMKGCRKGYDGIYLKKTNGNYEQLTAAEGTSGGNAGFMLINSVEADYAAQNFIVFEFEAIKEGNTTISFYEDSTGYDGYIGDPAGEKISLEIVKLELSSVITEKTSYEATGSAIEPKVTVTDSLGRVLILGTDYAVSYSDNVNAGTATVTITGRGKYEGTISTTFTITSSSGGGDSGGGDPGGGGGSGGESGGGSGTGSDENKYEIGEATISQQVMYYTGSEIRPAVRVVDTKGNVLVEGTDYTVAYKNNVKVGTATITVKGIGNYAGKEKTVQFIIANRYIYDIVLEKNDYAYTGKIIEPEFKVIDANNEALISGKDYTFECSNNKLVGKAELKVTGMGTYQGTLTREFNIVPKGTSIKSLKSGKKKATVKWSKPSKTYLAQMTGYIVEYSRNSKFTEDVTKSVKAGSKKSTSKTIKKLKSGKTYYFRVATYKKNADGVYQSGWSKVKKAKIK